MRGAWIAGLATLAGIAAAGSCALPPATVRDTGGGGGGTTSSGTTSTSTATGLQPPGHAGVNSILIQQSGEMTAQTGYAGQRHLIFARGVWWFFYPDTTGLQYRSSQDGKTNWGDPQLASSFPFIASSFPVPDGRCLGVDTATRNMVDVVHVSLESQGTTTPLAHLRGTLAGQTLGVVWTGPSSSDMATPIDPIEGPITAISSAGQVSDFSGVASLDPSSALEAMAPDTGGSWMPNFGIPSPLQGASLIEVRSAMALASDVYVVWRDAGGIKGAVRGASGWKGNLQLSSGTVSGMSDARTFATCVQQGIGHLVYWAGPSFVHISVSDGDKRGTPQPPKDLQGVTELVLACGPTRVHAFAVDTAHGDDILGASWDPLSGVWSEWTPVVDAPVYASGKHRCFLTGFDRVVSGSVGIAWSEVAKCTDPDAPAIFDAIVPVSGP